ncbi:hypothetical protein J2S43_001051 [Catenuloplanes nepalensis]|uniref:DUF6879 domain-containing protein n=1 Tax=Catenuloplanes nepalensis TaxID=587533 RepID=A0ABT9MM90_9ACTN|nr:DUF6879 family protein [Catenuloplanes nepalensis]MDP9792539.1 hypothetical protein [Catenuloplanes nepalensis]
MPDTLVLPRGRRLNAAAFKAEFAERFWNIREHDFWKLERQQTFTEPGDASWEAFRAGDWNTALHLMEARRAEYEDDARRMREVGLTSYRVRVIETPLAPYLQWELHLLRLMGTISDRIRVIDVSLVRTHESHGALPELVCLGPDLTFEVRYNENGAVDGAIRHTGTDLTSTCRRLIQTLYEAGEDVVTYVDREVAPLPPPAAF